MGKGRNRARYNIDNINQETISNELSLLNLGDTEGLNIKIHTPSFHNEIQQLEDQWVDYLPRPDRPNNRKGLALYNLPGHNHQQNPSQREASKAAGRRISETEFNTPTEIVDKLPSLHPIFNMFDALGRTFLVKCGIGGYFPPHRDHPVMPRETFRLIAFLKDCGAMDYDWIMGQSNKLEIDEGRVYYINTRKVHRTMSYANDSIHLIMNIPMTSHNVAKVIDNLLYTHG